MTTVSETLPVANGKRAWRLGVRTGSGSAAHHARRKIAHVALGTDVGGMERLLVEFARHSDRRRFEHSFISLQPRGPLARQIEALQCKVYDFDKADGLRPDLVFRLAWKLRRMGVQVVHTHNTAAMVYGVAAAKLARVPCIIHTRHGQRFGAPTRQTRLFRLLAGMTDRVVCVSEDSRQLTLNEGVDSARADTIPNGIDLSKFQWTGRQRLGPVVLVARLSREKDVGTLIRAIAAARSRQPMRDWRLDIVGDGPARTELVALLRELELEASVRLLGQREDVSSILRRGSMFVLPSLTEGISLTLLEAMAQGLPVVATRVGGNPEVIRDKRSGLLIPPGDVAAMTEAMCRLDANPGFADALALAARADVEERFSIKTMVARYERLYGEGAATA